MRPRSRDRSTGWSPRPESTAPSGATTTLAKTATASLPAGRSGRGKCFNYGRNCPYPKKGRQDEEARGQKRGTVSALTEEEEDPQTEMQHLKQRMEELQASLPDNEPTPVVNTVAADKKGPGGTLGPGVFVDVCVNGVPTRALVDTGSPATIASLDFVLGLFVKEKKPQQTAAEWKEAVLGRLSPPSVTLRAYSGHKLKVTAQVCLRLTYGWRTVEANVLVLREAPNDLLLGTDVQPQLGFSVVADSAEKLTDLLTGKDHVGVPARSW